jgi:hypothetical protein
MTSDKVPAPPSPSASFYDLSDDEEGEYNTITHTSSGRGVKLLYSKSKVCQYSGSCMIFLPGCLYLRDESTMADQFFHRSTYILHHLRRIIYPDILLYYNKKNHLS